GDIKHKDRAEVLEYNLCFGTASELAKQFKEVEKLSRRVEKPVLHLSLRLASGDQLTQNELIEISRECAKEFGIINNQYIAVLHKDTEQQHIHIAANRVGFDGKVASDKNDFRRMAALCRRLEKQYRLTEVLSPRSFLSGKERLLPRHDIRKEKLRNDIRQTLEKVAGYTAFEQQMKALGYKVIKGRGICFIDDKRVKIKGSEVNFSLAKIEKVLAIRQELEAHKAEKQILPIRGLVKPNISSEAGTGINVQRQLANMLNDLLKPEYQPEHIGNDLTPEQRRKKKQQQHL
ncbi:MAG TPA: relaxase/mobilization nuclease domain-containing protein, partial [Hanamia sp.]|nr:relaxase/mobilization nuclease domain-containing protein [Hanamia sp.]